MAEMTQWTIVRKPAQPAWVASFFITLFAILLSLAASSVLLVIAGVDLWEAFDALLLGAFGDMEGVAGSLVKAIPLVFAGLSAGLAFRARIWNVGQEGQIYAGSMLAYWLSTSVSLPSVLMIPLILVGGFAGGALLGATSGVLKSRFRVDEIVSTVMLNYVIVLFLSYLLSSKIWMEPGQYYMQTPQVVEASRLPSLFSGVNLHMGLVVAILALIAVQILLSRGTLGYAIRAFGWNPEAARFRGIDPNYMFVVVMVLSGGLAGMAGVMQTFGVDFRLTTTALQGLGATGIIVGVIAGMRPLGIGIAAVLFGSLAQGALFMEVMAGVSSAVVSAMQAIVLIVFISSSAFSRYRLMRVKSNV
jgi:simple sugar transport system permease protein